jgi:hypothetical protein
MSHYKAAIVKFNGGRGALLCNKCHIVIAQGLDHPDRTHFCGRCKQVRHEHKQSADKVLPIRDERPT